MNILRVFVMKSSAISLVIFFLSLSIDISAQETNTVYLSDLDHGFIANEYGPPHADQSFGKHPITLGGVEYKKGLGVHSPSKLYININRKVERFRSLIGIDDEVAVSRLAIQNSINEFCHEKSPHYKWLNHRDEGLDSETIKEFVNFSPRYVYDATNDVFDFTQGANVCFKVFADEELIYTSGWLSENSTRDPIDLNIKDVEILCLVVEKGNDGSFLDHANWADARLVLKSGNVSDDINISSYTDEVIMNHGGFLPGSMKTFRVMKANENDQFEIVSTLTNEAVITGKLKSKQGDWGEIFIGDFSNLEQPGQYYVRCGEQISFPFSIRQTLYTEYLKKHLTRYLWQRCGDPENGYSRGCHMDDGKRSDNGEHQSAVGGWHDAGDLRKWGTTIGGYFGLSEVALSYTKMKEFNGKSQIEQQLADEWLWGRKYYIAIQEPAGYIMNNIGGKYEDDRFTDNIVGNEDDRILVTSPARLPHQAMFVIAQCNLVLSGVSNDRSGDLLAAEKCYNWLIETENNGTADDLSAMLTASLKMYEIAGSKKYIDKVSEFLKSLLELQVKQGEPIFGFFMEPGNEKSETGEIVPKKGVSTDLSTPNFPIWSLVEAIRVIEDKDLNHLAREAFEKYISGYIGYFDDRSTYGIVPMALFADDPGGSRVAGNYFYRWCFPNNEDQTHWNGINTHILYVGAALVRGGRLTGNHKAIKIGQQQLDFVYGSNPFNVSTVVGVGYNQSDLFKGHSHVPYTPIIPGSIISGVASTYNDMPVICPGWWQTAEYWMTAVGGAIILLNELNIAE